MTMPNTRNLFAALQFLTTLPIRSAFTSEEVGALLLAPVFGRSLQVVGLTWMPYARPEGGLASVFLPFRSMGTGLWACLAAVAVAVILFGGTAGAVLCAAAALLPSALARSCRAMIGGMTGDTIGALSELGEALVLLLVVSLAAGGVLR